MKLKNIFIIPFRGEFIVYAPLQGYAFLCSRSLITELKTFWNNEHKEINVDHITHPVFKEYFQEIIREPILDFEKNNESIDTTNKLVVILSHRCNLSCSYCYAKDYQTHDKLSFQDVKIAIDYISSKINGKTKVFSFIGGGEPTFEWDLLKQSIDYIVSQSNLNNFNFQVRIITNATLLDKNRIHHLSKIPNIVINISSDILPDIQNQQRSFKNGSGSFNRVHEAIQHLIDYNIAFNLRSTITFNNVSQMTEMAEFAILNYKGIKRLHFEPVTDNNIDNKTFFRLYSNNFFKAFKFCEKHGVRLVNSFISSTNNIKYNFCSGEFCIVPGKKIIACHRHSSEIDPSFNKFVYGSIIHKKIEINQKKLNDVKNIRDTRLSYCENCFAKWHCSGGCASINQTYSPKNKLLHCKFVRDLISNYFYAELKKNEYETD